MITNVLTLFHILRVHYEWEIDCFILQGRVSTLFKSDGHIFSRVFVTFLPAYISAKIMKIECVFPELWSQMYCHVFFGSQCKLPFCQITGWIQFNGKIHGTRKVTYTCPLTVEDIVLHSDMYTQQFQAHNNSKTSIYSIKKVKYI